MLSIALAATGFTLQPQPQLRLARPPAAASCTMALPVDELPGLLVAASPATNAVPAAFAAYGHYLALLLGTASLTAERLTIKPAMSVQEEDVMAIADAVYGAAGLLLVVTGYLRVTQYGKGWGFYSHEPIF